MSGWKEEKPSETGFLCTANVQHALSAALSWISFDISAGISSSPTFRLESEARAALFISPFRFFVHWSTIAHQLSTPVIDPSFLVSFLFYGRWFLFFFFFFPFCSEGERERDYFLRKWTIRWKDEDRSKIDRMTDENSNEIYIYMYTGRENFCILPFSLSFPRTFSRISREYLKIRTGGSNSQMARFHHFREIIRRKLWRDPSNTSSSLRRRDKKKRKIRDGKEKEEIDSMIDRFPKKDERVSAR